MYMVSSVPAQLHRGHGGRVLARRAWRTTGFAQVSCRPSLGRDQHGPLPVPPRCSQDKFPDIIRKYGPGIEIENYPEAHCLASNMEDVTVGDITAIRAGPWLDYLDRARGVQPKR